MGKAQRKKIEALSKGTAVTASAVSNALAGPVTIGDQNKEWHAYFNEFWAMVGEGKLVRARGRNPMYYTLA